MKRIIRSIDPNVWYPIESLKKIFPNYNIKSYLLADTKKSFFTIIKFHKIGNISFRQHPKTKRLKYLQDSVYEEVEFVQ